MEHTVVEVETIIAASPHMVWDTMITNPSTLFLGAKVDTDWKVGHPITMSGDFNGKSFRDEGEIRAFDEDHRLSFTHRSGSANGVTNLVTFELQRQGQGTKVKLIQAPLAAATLSDEQKSKFAKTWSLMLGALKKEVESRP